MEDHDRGPTRPIPVKIHLAAVRAPEGYLRKPFPDRGTKVRKV